MSFLIKCLEWWTKLPERGYCSVKSHIFLKQGCECSLKLCDEYRQPEYAFFFNLYVEIKNEHLKLCPCDISIQIGFKNEQNLSLGTKTTRVSEYGATTIWCMREDLLKSKLPSDFEDDTWLKFIFHFEYVSLEVKKQTANKCFQTGSYLNTHVPVESLVEDMSKLLDSDTEYDVEIKCGEHSIKAHKIILRSRSEVFKAMLQSNMLEGRTGVVEIEDIDVGYIQDFIRYLYTGTMPELTLEKAKGLYEAGDKYAVGSLMIRCSEYLRDNLSTENVLECLALTDAHSDEKLKHSAITFAIDEEMYLDKIWHPFCEKYPNAAVQLYKVLHINDIKKKGV